MLGEFPSWPDRDHNKRFRAVGICGTSSLLAHDSEAPPKSVFLMGKIVPTNQFREKIDTITSDRLQCRTFDWSVVNFTEGMLLFKY